MVGPDLSLTTRTASVHVPGTRASGHRRGDLLAIAILIALPVVIFGIPAILGHAVLPGDDLTQNFPLRVLAGRQIRGGQLPLFDPYIWSGAPLLASWNAAAAYPLTFLFAVLPGTAAWTLNMIVTWAVAGLGMFFFLRALRLGRLPGLLGAVTFAFAGAMPAQVAHLGLVAGLSWVPVQLLSVLRLTETRGAASRLHWTAVLAGTFGLTILAGEPRAIADAAVIVVLYAAWRVARLGRRPGPAAISVAAGSVAGGLVLGICLGAVQWLPGLAAIGTSQRGASTVALFNSGSLPHRWLLLMLVPDLLGGSGSLGQPAFFANYNLAEVTGYAGILPLTAAAALLGRLRLRPRLPEWAIWHVMALVGFVLALGGNTPAGSLLVHLPLFGGLRLQSRNILVADLALAVLFAYWADQPLSDQSRRFLRAPGGRRVDLETALGLLPALAMIVVVVLGLSWGAGLLHWLRAGPGAAGAAGPLRPWLVPYALIGAGAVAFVVFGRRLQPRLRSRWLGVLIAIDLVVFTILSVVAVLPGLGSGPGPGRAADAAAGRGGQATAVPPSVHSGAAAPAPRPIAALGFPGRFAIYDPDQIAAHELPVLGAPDLNATSGTPSVQGYTSLVDGFYAAATGAHQAMGQGQDVLAPRAVGDGTLDQLNTSALLTPFAYLITRAGPGPAAGSGPAAGLGARRLPVRRRPVRDRASRHRREPQGHLVLRHPAAGVPARGARRRRQAGRGGRNPDRAHDGGRRDTLVRRERPGCVAAGHQPSAPGHGRGGGRPGGRQAEPPRPAVHHRHERERVRRQRAAAGRPRAAALGIRRPRRVVRRLRRPPRPRPAQPGGTPRAAGGRRIGAAGRRLGRQPDGRRGVLPARHPGRPLGDGDRGLERHLAAPARHPGRARRQPGRSRPGRQRPAGPGRGDLALPAARVPGRPRAVAGGRAHPCPAGRVHRLRTAPAPDRQRTRPPAGRGGSMGCTDR